MSGIALVIDWLGPSDAGRAVARMLDRIPHRGTDGRTIVARDRWALGYARRESARLGRAPAQPLQAPGRDLWIGADARIDNRMDLARALAGDRTDRVALSDAELLLLGYARWGRGLAARLEGDFAFVIWDPDRREVYAARDPFGAKPLFFHRTAERFVLATEVGQILALDGVPRDLEDRVVLDYLLDHHRTRRETFYRAVERLPAGHYLLASPTSIATVEHFTPPAEALAFSSAHQAGEALRAELARAVTARLDSSHPILAELSGGLDSSSIVCLAEAAFREQGDLPPLSLVSVTFPGLAFDESAFIDAVERAVRFEATHREALEDGIVGAVPFEISHPWRNLLSEVIAWEGKIAQARGARVLLSGVGGDELLFERGVYRDLAANGMWGALLSESLSPPLSLKRALFWMKDGFKAFAPDRARRAYRRLQERPPPAWLGPALEAPYAELAERKIADASTEVGRARSLSHTQAWNWGLVTAPNAAWDLEYDELDCARQGLEKRYPFLDKALVDLVVRIPFALRLPGGRPKALLRRALADVLPALIRDRADKPAGNALVERQVEHRLALIQEIVLSDQTWESAPYVMRSSVRDALAQIGASRLKSDWKASNWLWDVSMLEVWLRRSRETDGGF